MESKDAYRIEEIKLKVAQAQEEANSIRLKANKVELEIVKLRLKEKERITNTYEYLLSCNFGAAFSLISKLKEKRTTDSLLKDLEFIFNFTYGWHILIDELHKGKKGSLDDMAQNIASKFFYTYNTFIALGHPNYELVKVERSIGDLLSNQKLFLINRTRLELEKMFVKHLNAGVDKLFELFKIEKNKKVKIAEAEKFLAENR